MPSFSSTTITAVDQSDDDAELTELVNTNTDSILPTHRVPPLAHTLPVAHNSDPFNGSRTIASRVEASIHTRFTEETWFLHVERYAPVIGIVIAVVAIAVTVVGIIIGVIVAVTVK